jgi:acetolactate synthase I/II/III large subunit
MASQELERAVRVGAPIVVVVLADRSLSLIRILQHRRGLETYGVDMGRVDVAQVAGRYGAESARAATPEELGAVARTAIASSRPSSSTSLSPPRPTRRSSERLAPVRPLP